MSLPVAASLVNSGAQDSEAQELCHALNKSKLSEGTGRLVTLPKALLAHAISFLSLSDKAVVARTCSVAYAAYQTVHAFAGNDGALNSSLRKLDYSVYKPSFVKYFALFGPHMKLLELKTQVSPVKLVLLRNYMTKIQEAHLLGTSDANTLHGLVRTWPHLRRLDLTGFNYSPPSLAHIASCSHLRTLGLAKAIGDSDLEKLKSVLHNLEKLSVYGFAITVKGWSILDTECPKLQTLQMYDDEFSTVTPILSTIIPRMQKETRHPNRVIYDIFMQGYFKEGKLREAERLLAKMKIDRHPFVGTYYTRLMNGYVQAGKLMEAENVLKGMQRKGLRPDQVTYNMLINGYVKAGKLREAENVFKEMRRDRLYPDVFAYNPLIAGYAQAGKLTEAENVLKEMRREGLRPNEVTYNVLIDGYAKAGKLEDAQRMLKVMQRDGLVD